jgi:cyclopropane fatty-acyl-phospholipid synthase-like methyltransferase
VNELTFKFQRKTDEAIEAEARDKIRIETLERNLQMKAQDIQDLKSRMNESEKIISQNEKKYFTIDKYETYININNLEESIELFVFNL